MDNLPAEILKLLEKYEGQPLSRKTEPKIWLALDKLRMRMNNVEVKLDRVPLAIADAVASAPRGNAMPAIGAAEQFGVNGRIAIAESDIRSLCARVRELERWMHTHPDVTPNEVAAVPVVMKRKKISPRTGKPVRKYTPRDLMKPVRGRKKAKR